MILEGWRDAVRSGRYLWVRYDCASPSVAHWINRLAKQVGLTESLHCGRSNDRRADRRLSPDADGAAGDDCSVRQCSYCEIGL